MPPSFDKPVFVIAPGAALTPAHYGLFTHLLLQAGYGAISSLLPSTGTKEKVTVEDDARYIRERMILPIIDNEQHDVIVIWHSYSSLPGSAAAAGLSKSERAQQGKKTGVIGQICLAAILSAGGDGKDLVATFGIQTPPHIQVDEAANLVRCEDPGPPLFHDVEPSALADSVVASTVCPSLTSFYSPIPQSSWKEQGYQNRLAYIRTLDDRAIPVQVQDMMLSGSGVDWVTKDIQGSHDVQISKAKELAEVVLQLAQQFEKL